MQVSTRFTIAVHMITASQYFAGKEKVTSDFLAKSIGCNPVIVRTIMSDLTRAGLIESHRGSSGIVLTRPMDQITFRDIYRAVEVKGPDGMFHFHENPSSQCPIGRNIHLSLDADLEEIQEAFEDILSQYTLASVYERELAAIRAEEGKMQSTGSRALRQEERSQHAVWVCPDRDTDKG